MKSPSAKFLLPLLAAAVCSTAFADDDDDKHKHKKKQTYWDGDCKVERKWKHGEYEEKRKCKGSEAAAVRPVMVYPPWMVVQQGAPVYASQAVPAVPATGVFRCQSQAVGQVLGALIGGVLGNQLGSGQFRTVATVGGAVAGGLIGGDIGRRVDAGDQACVGQVLEFAPAGHRVQWASGGQQIAVVPGQVVPGRTSQCRTYTFEQQTAQGWTRSPQNACRNGDGVWVRG